MPSLPRAVSTRRQHLRAAASLTLVGLLAACAPPATPLADIPVAKNGNSSSEYVIGAGDTLGISVYQAPELSVPSVPVRPDGRISMPLIPEIMAAGKTPTELAAEITTRLKEYVKDPIVTVMVSNFVGPLSRQVKVIGAATDPQAIPYRAHMTLLDVMIAVKGLTRFAAGNQAEIVRTINGKQHIIHVHLDDLMNGGDISQNIEMQPGDTLIIPQSWF
ncbi:MAG: polysaccharide export protein [Rhodospirillales bacterium]|nr:polysaccharide export protein [Rhodospirillales bacterium]